MVILGNYEFTGRFKGNVVFFAEFLGQAITGNTKTRFE